MSTIVTRATKGSALTHTEMDANFTNLNNDKQETLVSGTTIKTINSTSLLGSGNIVIDSYTDSDALSLLNASGSAPVYACRAWVHFNGTATVAIRASGNVSSITDRGVGQYTVNLTTALQDTDGAILTNTIQASTDEKDNVAGARFNSTSAIYVGTWDTNGVVYEDCEYIDVAIIR